MSRARPLRWGLSGLAALAVAGCLSVPAAPECDDTHPCAAGLICRATSCVEADAAPATDLSPTRGDARSPGADADAPDAGGGDAQASAPDAALVAPDAAPVAPDAAPAPPDAGLVATDAALVAPDATLAAPDAGMPDGERCNGLDDDGDQSIDEGFDLTRDANNCGACGHVCGGLGMREVCRAGTCLPVGCQPGVFDENLDTSDGCEAAHAERTVYHVRAGEPGGDGNGVGTRERPFATIAAAAAAAAVLMAASGRGGLRAD